MALGWTWKNLDYKHMKSLHYRGMAEAKKKPTDYPIFGVRLSKREKSEIMERVEIVLEAANSKVHSGDKILRKNDIVLDALKRGLASLEKEHKIKS